MCDATSVTNGFAAAVIAAVVSIVVAVGSVIVTFLTTRAALRRDHERQEAELRRAMTGRLYDRRVEVYPGLFRATEAFRTSHLESAPDLRSHLARALEGVDAWHAAEGLMLSAPAYRELLELRRAVRAYLKEPSDSELLSQLKREIWHRKNGLRTAMRADLGLLFEEDQ